MVTAKPCLRCKTPKHLSCVCRQCRRGMCLKCHTQNNWVCSKECGEAVETKNALTHAKTWTDLDGFPISLPATGLYRLRHYR